MFNSIRGRMIATMLILNFAASTFYTIFTYQKRESDTIDAIDRWINSTAHVTANFMPEEMIDEAAKGNLSKETFDEYGWRVNNMVIGGGLEYIYLVINSPEGFRFVLDSPTPEEVANNAIEDEPLYIYSDSPNALKEAYNTGKTIYSAYADEWGSHRGVFVPLVTKNGTKYVSCADVSI